MARDHARYHDDVGAYLLGALSEIEARAFEGHLADCAECRDEVERLRPAAVALPRSVTPVAPPPRLKASLMEVVEREAGERDGRRAAPRRPVLERLRRLAPARPAFALGAALALAAAIFVAGWGVGRLTSDEVRTVTASTDRTRVPRASASLVVPEDSKEGAIVRVHGLPALGSKRTYQLWVQRGSEVIPEPTFDVGANGDGAAAVPEDLEGADRVMVTRERRGGARAPSERPILSFKL
jgi:anti-sigma-K factor RskA